MPSETHDTATHAFDITHASDSKHASAATHGTRTVPADRTVVLSRGRLRHALWALAFLLPASLGALQGCDAARSVRDTTLDKAVSLVPREFDVALGEQSRAAVLSRLKLVDDPAARADLAALAAPLLDAVRSDPALAKLDWQFHVAREAAPNAFAMPDGTIVVHSGLLAASGGADEVLGVLAHEVGHVVHRHGVRGLVNQVGIGLLLSLFLGDVGPLLAFGIEQAASLSVLQFSRDQERQADASGANMLKKASLPVAGMARFFRRLERLETSKKGDASVLASFPFLRTHPVSEERARALEPLAAESAGAVPPELLARYARWRKGILEGLPEAERLQHEKVAQTTSGL